MTAMGVIQKRVKGQLRGRILEEDHAVIYLQASKMMYCRIRNSYAYHQKHLLISYIEISGIRGWLAWRHFNSIDRKERQLAGDGRNAKTIEKKVLL